MLLGDGVAAVVLESDDAARSRGAPPLARLAGWGRAGDAYHVCQPSPDGRGLARAIGAALRRGRIDPAAIDYVNANGTGTSQADSAETAALDASALLEFVLTVLVLRAGLLPVNAGYLGPDPGCALDLVLGAARKGPGGCRHALSLNVVAVPWAAAGTWSWVEGFPGRRGLSPGQGRRLGYPGNRPAAHRRTG